MAGAEEANSVLGIVSFGLQLATTLQTYIEATREFKDRFFEIVVEINSTAATLRQLQDLLDTDEQVQDGQAKRKVFTQEGRQEIIVLTSQCGKLYTTIVVLLKKAGTATGKGSTNPSPAEIQTLKFLTSSNLRNLQWPWLEPRIQRCQDQLQWLKISLLFNLQLATLARFQLSTIRRAPGSFEEELAMRIVARRLRSQKLKFTKRLNVKHHLERQNSYSRSSCSISVAGSVQEKTSSSTSSTGTIGGKTNSLPASPVIKPVEPLFNETTKPETAIDLPSLKEYGSEIHTGFDGLIAPETKKTNQERQSKSFCNHRRKLNAWLRKRFGKQSGTENKDSSELEAYVFVKNSHTGDRLPLTQTDLSASFKPLEHSSKLFSKTIFSLDPVYLQEINQIMNERSRVDGRKRTCLAVETINEPVEKTMIYFSVGKLAEPVLLEDWCGREILIPFHLCKVWSDMHEVISQAFIQFPMVSPQINAGRYDVFGPDKQQILTSLWETLVKPGWKVKILMWLDWGTLVRPVLPPTSPWYRPGPPAPPSRRPAPQAGPPGWIGPPPGVRPHPGYARRNRRRPYDNTDSASSVADFGIEDGPENLGIEIDFEKEEKDDEMELGELLGKRTNAIDTQISESVVESDDDSDTLSSLSDD